VPGSETGVEPADALVEQLLPAFGNMPHLRPVDR
jgi:hypothetical protein